jgi:glycosyltransferase involved in cell wall biosynthesis
MIQAHTEKSQNLILSIIIATYNAELHIKGCLDSIVENVFESYELIIIDGKSTDSTLKIIKSFKSIDTNIISEVDKGIYDALNKGVGYARGKWVMFLGADDRLLPTFTSLLHELTDQQAIYYGNCKNGSNQLGGRFTAYKLAKMNLCHQAILYPLPALKRYQFDLNYPVFADYLLNMQCWGDASIVKNYLDIDIAYYHMEGFSATANDPGFRADKPRLVRQHLGYIAYFKYLFRKFKESRNPASKFF